MERKRRGTGEKFIVQGEMTKKPADWRIFLTNDENKKQLIQIMFRVWSSEAFAPNIGTRKVIFISEGHAYQLQTIDDGSVECRQVMSLLSNQEETDTRVILYCKYAQEHGYEHVRVRSPDSDLFFILLLYVHELTITVLFETGTGNRKRLINLTELAEDYTAEYSTALAALHVFTKCDTTSAFKGVGKIKPIKILQKNPRFHVILAQLGDNWEVSQALHRGLEEFTCILYGRKRFTSVDKLRFTMVKEKCDSANDNIKLHRNADLSLLPPCSRSLAQHIRRANYQMVLWRRAHIPVLHMPSPTDGHGWQLVNGYLEPLWFDGDAVPQFIAANIPDQDQNDYISDDEIDEVCVDEIYYSSDSGDEL